jgi:hypothetical protein
MSEVSCSVHAASSETIRGKSLHVQLLVRLLGCFDNRLAESALADTVDPDDLCETVSDICVKRERERERE